jgi:3-hydroxyacyl-CoA dehydrogenase
MIKLGNSFGKFFPDHSLLCKQIPEICDDVVNVDNALKWGFGWELGPFEAWDAIGLDRSVDRMNAEERKFQNGFKICLLPGKITFMKFLKDPDIL